MKSILANIEQGIANGKAKAAKKRTQAEAEHAKRQKEFQFMKDCARAIENAADRHDICKFELVQELENGKALDLALMKLDDIEMKEEVLQNRIDRLNEKLKDAAINQFNQS